MKKTLLFTAVAALALLGLMTSSADAATQVLGNSGWTATWQSQFVNVNFDFDEPGQVRIEKFIQFTDSTAFSDPTKTKITFSQTSVNAVPLIIMNGETVVNQTGQAWGGFRFILEGGANGSGVFTHFDPTNTFNPPDANGWNIDPFTTATFGSNAFGQADTVLTFGGGVVPSNVPGEDVWSPGGTSGELRLLANPVGAGSAFTNFVLKEQPIAIPLPAAAWTGLSGLVGLGLFGSFKKIRSLIA